MSDQSGAKRNYMVVDRDLLLQAFLRAVDLVITAGGLQIFIRTEAMKGHWASCRKLNEVLAELMAPRVVARAENWHEEPDPIKPLLSPALRYSLLHGSAEQVSEH